MMLNTVEIWVPKRVYSRRRLFFVFYAFVAWIVGLNAQKPQKSGLFPLVDFKPL